MANHEKPDDSGKCPDGYRILFGNICLKKTVLDKAEEPLKQIKMPKFTSVACEAALAALKTAVRDVQRVLELPMRYMEMIRNLCEYPFDVAASMIAAAMSSFNEISREIDNILHGNGPIGKGLEALKSALEGALDCPLMADTPIGKAAGELLDKIEEGADIQSTLMAFKALLAHKARELLERAAETPTQAINNIVDSYDQALRAAGVDDLMRNLRGLERCMDRACETFKKTQDFLDSLPDSSDGLIEKAGMTAFEEGKKFAMAPVKGLTEAGKRGWNAAKELASVAKTTKG